YCLFFFFFSSRRRHTRSDRDWSSDVCSSDLAYQIYLLMNSMYGRFGMHTDDLRYSFLNEAQITKLSRDYIIKEVLPFGELSLVRSEERRVGKECRSRV